MRAVLPSFGTFLLTAALSAQAATVRVTVRNIRNDHGHVFVALCQKAEFLKPHCALQGKALAQAGEITVTLSDVPPGAYAAQAFHDENDSGRLDRNFLGMPKEGMGFSRDVAMHFGPPGFDAAAVQVGEGMTEIGFSLKYF